MSKSPAAMQKAWQDKNKTYCAHQRRAYHQRERVRLIEAFGGICAHCGYSNPVALDFDHIYNDGYKSKPHRNTLSEVRRSPDRFQLLCRNCNWIKEIQRRQLDPKIIGPAVPTGGGFSRFIGSKGKYYE